jgi:hypothetical protein
MNLYIETENGATKKHPAFEDNLIEAFGAIPAHWEPFIRVEKPQPTLYQVLDSEEPTYAKVNGVWTDVWVLRDMTAEENTAKHQVEKDRWAALPYRSNFTAWIFNENINRYEPPIPKPEFVEGKDVRWCGADNNWKEVPARPEGEYKFDFIAWAWVAI